MGKEVVGEIARRFVACRAESLEQNTILCRIPLGCPTASTCEKKEVCTRRENEETESGVTSRHG
jgi:hypothetical protein